MSAATVTAPGPFLVRQIHLPEHDGATGWENVEAVATLEEAQAKADDVVADYFYKQFADREELLPRSPYNDLAQQARSLLPGDRITLPDGTRIEVETTTWERLAREAGLPDRETSLLVKSGMVDPVKLCAAWTASQQSYEGKGARA